MIRIPKAFLDDHEARDLPTPTVIRSTARHYFIAADDPAVIEIEADAEHYTREIDLAAFPDLIGLVSSARATLAAIRKARAASAGGAA